MYICRHIKKFGKLCAILGLLLILSSPAQGRVLYVSEDEFNINSDTTYLDADDSSPDFIDLEFGTAADSRLRFDISNDKFVLNRDVDFEGNELLNVHIENLASAPTCDGTAIGRVYYNTTDNNSYICNGTIWEQSNDTGFAQTVTVAKSGGDFTSVKSALDSITDSSSSKRYTVLVYPGTYTEDAMTIPTYVSLTATGNFENTLIVASTASTTLITAGHDSVVQNIQIRGTPGGVICYQTDDTSYIQDMELRDCDTGIYATGASAQLKAQNILVHGGTFTNVVKVDGAADVHITDIAIHDGTITNGISVTGDGSELNLGNAEIISSNVTNGVYVNNSVVANVPGLTVKNATYGIHVGPVGSATVQGPGGLLMNNTTDLYVESGLTKVFLAGWRMNKDLLDIHEDATVVLSFNDDTLGDESFSIFGELSVGTPEHPYESIFGEGDSYVNGMLVYTYNGSTYTDVSTAAASASGSTFTIPGITVDNALYISSDRKDSGGAFVKYPGYKLAMGSTGLALGAGEVVHEYWNGSAWTEFMVLCTHSSLYYYYSGECFLRPSSSEHVRFDENIIDSWVANDPPTTGTSRYWSRIRVKTAITTAPIFEQFKIHTNRLEINPDGTLSTFGSARTRRTFIVSPETIFYSRGSNGPDNTSFVVGSSGWAEERTQAAFNGVNLLEEATGSISLPKGIDISSNLNARIYWKKSDGDTGNVKWNIDYLVAEAKNIFVSDGANIAPAQRTSGTDITSYAAKTIQTSAEGSGDGQNAIIVSEFSTGLDISGCYEGDTIFLRLYRDPTDADDTYGSDAIMVGFEMDGVFWAMGERAL